MNYDVIEKELLKSGLSLSTAAKSLAAKYMIEDRINELGIQVSGSAANLETYLDLWYDYGEEFSEAVYISKIRPLLTL